MDYIYNPVVTSAVVAIVLTVVIAFLLIRSAANIGKGIKWLFKKTLTMQAFFWLVNIICMAFSAQNAGYFFGLYEPIGLAVAFVLDLMIIAFTSAMLSARAQGDEKRARLILCFIFLCAFLSTVGNLVHNLQTQQLVNDKVNHVWFQQVLPYVASCIPLFLVLLAFVADLVTKVNLEKVDVAEFEAMERKRAEIMEKRNEYMGRQLKAEERFRALLLQKKANKRQGVIRDFRWPWEPRVSVQQIANQVSAQLPFETLQQELTTFIQQTQSAHLHLVAMVENQAQQIANIEQQKDVDNTLFMEQIRLSQEEMMQALKSQIHDAMKSVSSMQKDVLQESIATRESAPIKQEKAMPEEAVKGQKASASSQGNAENSLEDDERTQWVLQNYPIVSQWQATGVASVTIEQIKSGTGHTPQKVHRHHAKGAFKKTRRPDHYRVDSVIEWLKNEPLPKAESTSKESNNTDTMEVVKDVKPPVLKEVTNDPDTGEYEAVTTGDLEELSA